MPHNANSKRWTTLVRLAALLALTACVTACPSTGSLVTAGEGAFCRLYQPVPVREGSGPAIDANEITYCVKCDATCPDAIVKAWLARRDGDGR